MSMWPSSAAGINLISLLEVAMQFLITEVEFDFETDFDDEAPTPEEKADIISDTVGQVWEADDEEDLIEELTCAYGWCIKTVDFKYVLS